ncbi:MAG: Thiol-disulfide oxidoreductase protein [Acidobacteria bacterium]|nr:Thiol-disulfide oxidoreductase protein [Acidobacteriota bacterium]
MKGKKNVRRKQLFTSLALLIMAAVAFAGFAPLQAQQKKAAAKAAAKPKITVMNPIITSKMVDRTPLSPRLQTLEGKTLYLVDISWGGPEAAYSVFEEIQSWFAQNMPSTKIIIKRKTGMYTQDDPRLWKEIAANGNAALIGISG